jgi:hypothetical protein
MIVAATVERFRGLQRLEVDGFGRVNLIIGRNDCGKTALMEALMIAEGAEGASHRARFVQQLRRPADASDFGRFWRPLFWNQDADRGFRVALRNAQKTLQVEFRKGSAPPLMVTEPSGGATPLVSWAVDVRITDGGERTEPILGNAGVLTLAPLPSGGARWITPGRSIGPEEIGLFSKLKYGGSEGQLLDLVKEIDDRISGIEILSPTGTEAELFVRLQPDSPLLPIAMMGDGLQRCFEIGVAAAAHEWPFLYIDEIDNGLHHSTLEPVWRWLANISRRRGLQVFATTHSEECIHAAARAFTGLSDDGLRVIRLDRHEDRTTAAIYDRDLVEATERMGMEIRG